MAATAVTPDDLDWLVEVLRRRRKALAPHAPVFWRPAPDADARHRAHLHHILTEGGARAWRTSTSVLVAAPRGGEASRDVTSSWSEPTPSGLGSRRHATSSKAWSAGCERGAESRPRR